MTDKILKIAKRLKTFTLEDIVMFTGLEIDTVRNFLDQSDNIQKFKNEFEYVGIIQKEETFKIIDKNIDANVFIEDGLSQVGGGSMPLETIKTKVVAITPKNMSVSSLEKKLRLSNSHIIARIYDNKYILDVRTIFEEEFEIIANELKKVLN